NHGGWRSELRRLGRVMAVRASEDEALATSLEALRRSGDYEGTALVAERLANKGAHKAIRPLTQDATTPRWWTRTSAHANWKLLAPAGPLLETRAASVLVRF